MSWNAENEVYRCMVDTIVRMLINLKTETEIKEEIEKRSKDLKDIESQMTFITNFNFIVSRLWIFNTSDKTLQDLITED